MREITISNRTKAIIGVILLMTIVGGLVMSVDTAEAATAGSGTMGDPYTNLDTTVTNLWNTWTDGATYYIVTGSNVDVRQVSLDIYAVSITGSSGINVTSGSLSGNAHSIETATIELYNDGVTRTYYLETVERAPYTELKMSVTNLWNTWTDGATYYIVGGSNVDVRQVSPDIYAVSITGSSGINVTSGSLSGTARSGETATIELYNNGATRTYYLVSVQIAPLTVTISTTAGGSVSQSTITNVTYGSSITVSGNTITIDGTTVTATSNAGFAFSSWSNATGTVTTDRTILANFSALTYTVTWEDYDGTVLETDTGVAYGATPSYDGATPTRSPTAQYTYTFTGWVPTIAPVTGDITYTAQYSSTVNTYTVTWEDYDGTVLETDTGVAYGATPSYDGATPTRSPTAQYTYTFTGWAPTIAPVTGDITYTAQFSSTVNTYTITWENYDGTVLETDTGVAYGATPSYDGATPSKPSTAQYAYTFNGWSPTVVSVTGNATYTAQFTQTTTAYKLTWDANGGYWEDPSIYIDYTYVAVGSAIGANMESDDPFRPSYVFNGWWTDPSAGTQVTSATIPTSDSTYYAHWTTGTVYITWDANGGYWDGIGYTITNMQTQNTHLVLPDDPQFTGYTLVGWFTEAVGGYQVTSTTYATATTTYYAHWSANTNTVTWKNYDGTILETDYNVPSGTTPTYNSATPTRASTAQYTYTFSGWNPTPLPITGDTVYTAQFTQTVNEYTITWKNYNGTTLDTDSVAYGSTPVYSGATPTRASTAQYSYSFSGWDPTVVPVTGNATYTAQFTQSVRTYTITWKNYNGTTLDTDSVAYGSTPVYSGATPTKPSTSQYSYSFSGWSPTIVAVTGNQTYTAQFTQSVRNYTVTWENYDGSVLETDTVAYGSTPTYDSATPTRPPTAEYTYTFNGWNPTIAAVTGNQTYTAQYTTTTNHYTLTWNANGGYWEDPSIYIDYTYVNVGSAIGSSMESDDPFRPSYVFDGWWTDPSAGTQVTSATIPTSDSTYYAHWTTGTVYITWDANGGYWDGIGYTITNMQTQNSLLSLPTDPQLTGYTLVGWFTEAVGGYQVTGSTYATATTTYYAHWSANMNTITWENYDGSVLETDYDVPTGTTPTYNSATPTKPSTAQYTYTFSGWYPTVVPATGDATYTAQFSSTVNNYTITWENYDGTVLGTDTVAYGTIPTYTGATPTKPSTVQYTYTFSGWNPTIVAVTGNATYTAQFTQSLREYTITWENYNGTILDTDYVAYGSTPTYDGPTPTKPSTAQYNYTFSTWSPTVVSVTGNATYTAQFTQSLREYTITWKNYDGTTLDTDTVAYGSTPAYTGATPTRSATQQYTYTFSGWNPTIVAVVSNATYTAQYTSTVNEYTITWKNYNGTVLETDTVAYGQTPTYDGATPTRASTAQYTYTFSGWDPAIASVVGSQTYTAQFSSTVNTYTITWKNYDGTTLDTDTVAYGQTPVYTGATPTKPASYPYVYVFDGWSPTIVAVTGNAAYTAQFTEASSIYTLTWNANGGYWEDPSITIDQTVVNIGDPIGSSMESDDPFRPNYVFAGWYDDPTGGNQITSATVPTSDSTYYAHWTTGTVYITWNANGGLWDGIGDTITNMQTQNSLLSLPTDPQLTGYTLVGWFTEAVGGYQVTGSTYATATATYYAHWSANLNTVIWKNYDGTVLETDYNVQTGTTPTYDGATPVRPSTAQYTYSFSGWSPTPFPIVGDMIYTAQYSETLRSYTITWENYDGSVLRTDSFAYGSTPVYAGATPTKPSTVQYSYTFSGWSPTITMVIGDKTYTAQFTQSVRNYTITWENYDGSVLRTDTVAYGMTPIYSGPTPTKPSTSEHSYVFIGWSPSVVPVIDDTTYTAQFDETARIFVITWVNYDGTVLEVDYNVQYGSIPTYDGITPVRPTDADYIYTFAGWNPAVVAVTDDQTYTAEFSRIPVTATTFWSNDEYNGAVSVLYHMDDGIHTKYNIRVMTSLYVYDESAADKFRASAYTVEYGVRNVRSNGTFTTEITASVYSAGETVVNKTLNIGKWSNVVITLDAKNRQVLYTTVNGFASFTQYEEKTTSVLIDWSAVLPTDTMAVQTMSYMPINEAPRQQVVDTTVFLNTYGVVMIDPTFDVDTYWPDQTNIRMHFFSFALYGTSITLNGIQFDVVDGSKVVIPYKRTQTGNVYDADGQFDRKLTLTNLYLTWQDGHCYLTFSDANDWTVDLGTYSNRQMSMSGMWYFQSGVYESKTTQVTEYTKDWSHIAFDFQTFILILLGLLVALGIYLRVKTKAKVSDLLIVVGAIAIAWITLGGLVI